MARGPLRISRAGQPRTVKHLGPGTLDFALRSVRGGKRSVMEELTPRAMEFEPRLERAVAKWQQLTPWQRRFVTLDDLATEAGLTKGEFLAAVVRAGFEFSGDITDLLVACAFPSVVAASVKRAKTLNGFADRQLLFEHMTSLSEGRTRAQAANEARDTAGKSDARAMDPDYLSFLRNPNGSERTADQ